MQNDNIVRTAETSRSWWSLPRPVWMLGWTSLFTDSATEAIYPLLPVFLTRVLGASAVSLGIIEGVAEGANSVLKVISGRLADRWQVRKPLVIGGYALSSIARPFIAVTATWLQVLGIRFLDRVGKGVRSAPRDAMLAHFANTHNRGKVFGFHRAMDHLGAVVGPLYATAFLLVWPTRYRLLFATTIVPGLLATALLFRVPETRRVRPEAGAGGAAVPQSARIGARPEAASSWRDLPPRLWRFFGVLWLFALGNSTDAFLLLRLSDMGVASAMLPLLWAALHVVKASLSVYGGALSDRVGRRSVIAAGWCVYAIVYLGFATTVSLAALIGWFLLYGLYFGLAEGTEKALVADLTPARLGGTAFGVYNAVIGVGALTSSILFGALWRAFGAAVAFGTGAALAGIATVLLLMTVPPSPALHDEPPTVEPQNP